MHPKIKKIYDPKDKYSLQLTDYNKPDVCNGCIFENENSNGDCIIVYEFNFNELENYEERTPWSSIGCQVGNEDYIYVKSLKKTLEKL